MPDIFVGGRYIQERGHSVREIEEIHGDDIHWRDSVAPGVCSKKSFMRWLGSGGLAPDSPAPPKTSGKPSKRITEEVLGYVDRELTPLQTLADLNIESENVEKRALIGVSMWGIRMGVNRINEEIKKTWAPRLPRITRIDRSAETLQRLIPCLIETLTPSGPHLEAVSPQVLQALSAGLASVNRLRADLAPYLGQ